jgi:hypothetical protein
MGLVLLLAAALIPPSEALQRALEAGAGVVELPAGRIDLHEELVVPEGAQDLEIRGAPSGTVLRLAPNFHGQAVLRLRHASRIRLHNFQIDGNRQTLGAVELPPHDTILAGYYPPSGLLLDSVRSVTVSGVRFREIAGFAVVAIRSRDVTLDRIEVTDSGSRRPSGSNNASGGVLFSEGTLGFEVRHSVFRNILGNAVWTHSVYASPRNRHGWIHHNRFETIGRDAIQVGHASQVRVERNTGRWIGYPFEAVDGASGGTPVAIDTAGEVDYSLYAGNRFEEINGKCIDLDGFHDGEVRGNECVNGGRAEDYPHGHFGIVVNNWNPDMRSERILIADNLIDGFKFGGIFLIGRGHQVVGNRLLHLNRAGCNESAARFGCVAIAGEPGVLESGIYLGRLAAEWAVERQDPSREHVIRDNVITGHKMSTRCIGAAPGVRLADSIIENNRCEDAP